MDLNQETDCKSVLGLRMKGLRQLDWRDAKICVFSVLFCQTLKYRCRWSLVPSVFSLLCTQMMCAVPMHSTHWFLTVMTDTRSRKISQPKSHDQHLLSQDMPKLTEWYFSLGSIHWIESLCLVNFDKFYIKYSKKNLDCFIFIYKCRTDVF